MDALLLGGTDAELALKKLYDTTRGMVLKLVMQNSGSRADGLLSISGMTVK